MKKCCICLLAIIIVTCMNSSIFANDSVTSSSSISKTKELSEVYNLTDEEIKGLETFPDEVKNEIEDCLKKHPNSVEITHQVCEVDEIGEIQKIAQSNIKELQQQGMTKKEAKDIKNEIEDIQDMKKNKLIQEYNMTKSEATLLKEAVKESETKEKYKEIDEKDKCSASGSISSKKNELFIG